MNTFADLVKNLFAFLETDFQFIPETTGENRIEYKSPRLHVLFGWYKGEIDIDFYVQAQTKILVPYRTRMFRLYEVVRYFDKHALESAPKFPNYITALDDCRRELNFAAKVMRAYCADVLKGDITTFEKLANRT